MSSTSTHEMIDGAVMQLEDHIDKIKYHEKVFTSNELVTLFEALVQLLEHDVKGSVFDQKEIDDISHEARDVGFRHARVMVVSKVLENPKLKTRGEMIKAVDLLEWS